MDTSPKSPTALSILYECQVCLNSLLDGKCRILPCGHYYCHDCLERLVEESKIKCPTCRKEEKLPDCGVAGLPLNYCLSTFKDVENELLGTMHKQCMLCALQQRKTLAVCKCLQCFQVMCADCQMKHDSLALFRNHAVEMFDVSDTSKCTLHGLPSQYYCTHCWIQLCISCIFSESHGDHSEAIKTREDMYKIIESTKAKCQNMIQSAKGRANLHIKSEQLLTELKEKIVNQIDELYLRQTTTAREKLEDIIKNLSEVQQKLSNCTKSLNIQFLQDVHDRKPGVFEKEYSLQQLEIGYPDKTCLTDTIDVYISQLDKKKNDVMTGLEPFSPNGFKFAVGTTASTTTSATVTTSTAETPAGSIFGSFGGTASPAGSELSDLLMNLQSCSAASTSLDTNKLGGSSFSSQPIVTATKPDAKEAGVPKKEAVKPSAFAGFQFSLEKPKEEGKASPFQGFKFALGTTVSTTTSATVTTSTAETPAGSIFGSFGGTASPAGSELSDLLMNLQSRSAASTSLDTNKLGGSSFSSQPIVTATKPDAKEARVPKPSAFAGFQFSLEKPKEEGKASPFQDFKFALGTTASTTTSATVTTSTAETPAGSIFDSFGGTASPAGPGLSEPAFNNPGSTDPTFSFAASSLSFDGHVTTQARVQQVLSTASSLPGPGYFSTQRLGVERSTGLRQPSPAEIVTTKTGVLLTTCTSQPSATVAGSIQGIMPGLSCPDTGAMVPTSVATGDPIRTNFPINMPSSRVTQDGDAKCSSFSFSMPYTTKPGTFQFGTPAATSGRPVAQVAAPPLVSRQGSGDAGLLAQLLAEDEKKMPTTSQASMGTVSFGSSLATAISFADLVAPPAWLTGGTQDWSRAGTLLLVSSGSGKEGGDPIVPLPAILESKTGEASGWRGAGDQLFASPGGCKEEGGNEDSVISFDPHYDLIAPLPPLVETKTGKEDETVRFSHRVKLYRLDSNQWKERGVGDIKILTNNNTGKSRILMQREQVLKVCCNHHIAPTMKLEPHSISTLMWQAMDYSEKEAKFVKFAVKFKEEYTMEEFRQTFINCQTAVPISKQAAQTTEKAKDSHQEPGPSTGEVKQSYAAVVPQGVKAEPEAQPNMTQKLFSTSPKEQEEKLVADIAVVVREEESNLNQGDGEKPSQSADDGQNQLSMSQSLRGQGNPYYAVRLTQWDKDEQIEYAESRPQGTPYHTTQLGAEVAMISPETAGNNGDKPCYGAELGLQKEVILTHRARVVGDQGNPNSGAELDQARGIIVRQKTYVTRDQGSPYNSSELDLAGPEVAASAPVLQEQQDDDVIVKTTASGTGDRGNPCYSTELDVAARRTSEDVEPPMVGEVLSQTEDRENPDHSDEPGQAVAPGND